MWRDLLVCASLANLLWVRSWAVALTAETPYFAPESYWWMDVASAAFHVVLTTVLLFLASRLVRRWPARPLRVAARLALVACTAVGLHGLWMLVPIGHPDLSQWPVLAWAMLVVLVLGGAVATIRWPAHTQRAARTVLLILSPFILVTFAQGARILLFAHGEGSHAKPSESSRKGPRLVWILFDGMSQVQVFARPDGARLYPNLHALAGRSVSFTNAHPAGPSTETSVPGMFTGRRVVRAEPHSATTLELVLDDGSKTPWTDLPTVFDHARSQQAPSAVVGWYHPYCRMFEDELHECAWWPYATRRREPLLETTPDQLRLLLDSFPFARLLGVHDDREQQLGILASGGTWHARAYRELHSRALEVAGSDRFRLVYLHYPIPHLPVIYDPDLDAVGPNLDGPYSANLQLVDRSLGELLDAIGDDTWILVTSDHPPPGSGERTVPLIVHAPGQTAGIESSSPVDLIHIGNLVRDILSGRVTGPTEIPAGLGADSP